MNINAIARTGLTAKGVVYCLLGALAFMAAFDIAGVTTKDTEKEKVFEVLLDQPFGKLFLGILIAGLICYALWRFLQAFLDIENKGKNLKGVGRRSAYFFSGAAYSAAAYSAFKLLNNNSTSSSKQQGYLNELLKNSSGWIVIAIIAIIIAGTGIYQIYYGWSEKYRKHVDNRKLNQEVSLSLMRAGKIGYMSRGLVWLIISLFFFRAAFFTNSGEAGSTGKALGFIQDFPYGSYLLGLTGLGLICYGVFNFIRAAFEKFSNS